MSIPACRTGVTASTRFASPTLRRVCIAHRATVLNRHLSNEKWRRQQSDKYYHTIVSDKPYPPNQEDGHKSPQTAERQWRLKSDSGRALTDAGDGAIKELDPYLPLHLRSGTWLENLSAFQGVRNPSSLPEIVGIVDNAFPNGVLTWLALEQGRWSAFVYLSKAVIQAAAQISTPPDGILAANELWQHVDLPYPGLLVKTYEGLYDVFPLKPTPSTNAKAGIRDLAERVQADSHSFVTNRTALGMLWRALGHIVIKAATLERDDTERIMSYVHQVLSFMHQENMMHPNIYKFDSDKVCDIYRKSPFLHLMSSRMMTAISDSTWKADEDKVIDSYTWMSKAYASAEGLELKDLYPTVRTVGPEAWLDLILWSCVYGGHFEAGADLLRRMASSQGSSKWHSISWTALLEENIQKTDIENAEKLRQRFDQVAGAHEGYSRDPPLVTLPKRTISSEAVVALIDNLTASSPRTPDSNVTSDIALFRTLLRRTNSARDRDFWTQIAIRSVEFASTNPDVRPSFLESVADMVSLQTSGSEQQSDVATPSAEYGTSAEPGVVGSLYYRAFAALVSIGDLNEALRVFLRLQNWVDKKKRAALGSFFSSKIEDIEDRTEVLNEDLSNAVLRRYGTQVAPATLASFMDLLVKHRMFDLAKWLLSSSDPDGPVITHEIRFSAAFIPALLRYATATRKYDVVYDVVDAIQHEESLLTANVLHCLLRAQIEFHKFEQVESILQLIVGMRGGVILAEDVMILAREIMRLEKASSLASKSKLVTARQILGEILNKKYLRRFLRDRHVYVRRLQEFNQLGRIVSSAGVVLHGQPNRASRTIGVGAGRAPVPASAFNALLQGVVEARGAAAGKAFFDEWCELPQAENLAFLSPDADVPVVVPRNLASRVDMGPLHPIVDIRPSEEKVVRPDKYTIQIIMDDLLLRGSAPSKKEAAEVPSLEPVLSWDESSHQQQHEDTVSARQEADYLDFVLGAKSNLGGKVPSDSSKVTRESIDANDDAALLEWCQQALRTLDDYAPK